jgi:F420-dependent oxidoreductase-like protein
MRIGIFGGTAGATVDDFVAAARTVKEQGFSGYWLPQIFGVDALTTLAVIGREVDGIELGTAVVPTYPRHPMVLAGQALTVQSATGNRLTLGIGLSHQLVIEGMFGYSFEKPVRHMREYLSVIRPLIHGEALQFQGETVKAMTLGPLDIGGTEPCPIVVAALGEQMLRLTAQMAEGTITWMTGAATIERHTVPTITAAAEAAGRPAPRIICGLPVCVTDDVDATRERAATQLAIYGQLPSYRAMLDREGLEGPADMVIAGDEKTVEAEIRRAFDAGATDVLVAEAGGSKEEHTRTRELLQSLL